MSQVSESIFSETFSSQNEEHANIGTVLVPDSQNDSPSEPPPPVSNEPNCMELTVMKETASSLSTVIDSQDDKFEQNQEEVTKQSKIVDDVIEDKSKDDKESESNVIDQSKENGDKIWSDECQDLKEIRDESQDTKEIRDESQDTKEISDESEYQKDDPVGDITERSHENGLDKENAFQSTDQQSSDETATIVSKEIVPDNSTVNENSRTLRKREPRFKSKLSNTKFKQIICNSNDLISALEELKIMKVVIDNIQQSLTRSIDQYPSDTSSQESCSDFVSCNHEILINLDDLLSMPQLSMKDVHPNNMTTDQTTTPNKRSSPIKRNSRAPNYRDNTEEGDIEDHSAVTKESLRKSLSKKKQARTRKSSRSPAKKTTPKRAAPKKVKNKRRVEASPSHSEEENDDDEFDAVIDTAKKSLRKRVSQQKDKVLNESPKGRQKRTRRNYSSDEDQPIYKSPKNHSDNTTTCSICLQDLTAILKNVDLQSIKLSDLSRDQRKMLLANPKLGRQET